MRFYFYEVQKQATLINSGEVRILVPAWGIFWNEAWGHFLAWWNAPYLDWVFTTVKRDSSCQRYFLLYLKKKKGKRTLSTTKQTTVGDRNRKFGGSFPQLQVPPNCPGWGDSPFAGEETSSFLAVCALPWIQALRGPPPEAASLTQLCCPYIFRHLPDSWGPAGGARVQASETDMSTLADPLSPCDRDVNGSLAGSFGGFQISGYGVCHHPSAHVVAILFVNRSCTDWVWGLGLQGWGKGCGEGREALCSASWVLDIRLQN